MDLAFLKSNRFYVLVIAAIVGILKAEGIIDVSVADPLIALALAFVGVRTIDRVSEYIGEK